MGSMSLSWSLSIEKEDCLSEKGEENLTAQESTLETSIDYSRVWLRWFLGKCMNMSQEGFEKKLHEMSAFIFNSDFFIIKVSLLAFFVFIH